MIQITLADAINHIADCGQCAHLKDHTHEFTKALLRRAIITAHNKRSTAIARRTDGSWHAIDA